MWLEYVILLFLGLFEISSSSTESWTTVNELSTADIESQNIQPFFENTTQRSVIAAVGRTAQLHCKVRNLGDRAASHKVSWIRKRDLHILTIGIMTYTNDQRFQAMHLDDTDEWILKIVSVQPRDSGIYECQVSTEPKISQAYRLTVVVSKAKILANPELFFKSGSDINLTCIATQAPAPPSYIYWYKDGDLINYSQRGGINVLTERQTKTSKLVIARVVPSDSGNYTCTPSNSNSDSVYVHVIKSEHRAAMQHENSCKMIAPDLTLNVLALFYLSRYWHLFYDIWWIIIIKLLPVTAAIATTLQIKSTASPKTTAIGIATNSPTCTRTMIDTR